MWKVKFIVRAPTKSDKERKRKLEDLGCIVCLEFLSVLTPPAIHHIDGQTKEGCHQLTIGLCGLHHQIPSNTGKWVSRHGDGKKAFEEAYGTEQELLELTNEMIR